jgi:hypothetical protein
MGPVDPFSAKAFLDKKVKRFLGHFEDYGMFGNGDSVLLSFVVFEE